MAANTYRVTVAYNVEGQFATNSFHWNFDDAGYASSALAASALISRWIAVKLAHLQNLLSTHVTLLTVKARRVTGAGGFEAIDNLAPGTTGAIAGILQNAGVGPVIVCYPLGNGKQRGRVFLPGMSAVQCTNGVISEAFKTGTQTDVDSLFTSMVLVGGGTPTATSVIFKSSVPQSSVTVDQTFLSDTLGTQRRRQVPV